MSTFTQRTIGAARLDVDIYEEVEADTTAMGQAMTLVVLSSLAAGVGSFREVGVVGVLITSIVALAGWFLWAGLTYLIGTKILPEPQTESNVCELLRTSGVASSPGLLRVFSFLPAVGTIITGCAIRTRSAGSAIRAVCTISTCRAGYGSSTLNRAVRKDNSASE